MTVKHVEQSHNKMNHIPVELSLKKHIKHQYNAPTAKIYICTPQVGVTIC